jgi:hypothetical protein
VLKPPKLPRFQRVQAIRFQDLHTINKDTQSGNFVTEKQITFL